VLEQTLGHVTHAKNLQALLPETEAIEPTFALVRFEVEGWRARIPGFSNWTIRAGLRARRSVRGARRARGFDAVFVHTQVPAVLLGRASGGLPTIVSLDATPKQYDSLGAHYQHAVGHPIVERAKDSLNKRCFERASHLVAWTSWTKQSVVEDYGIESDKVTVIAPGVDTHRWMRDQSNPDARATDDTVRILFVGGDLARKGGHHLLRAFERVRRDVGRPVELHLVTTTPVDPGPGVEVHDSMTPNSADLIDLYHRCDVFCLPTLGDCLPMVLAEAAAADLAIVSTDVGAIGELVRDGETGLLVPPDDPDAIELALRRLIDGRELRERLGTKARELVVAEHDAARNAERLVELIRSTSRR
jgi:glycosyltransferase involved in cell wall biosynthesis